MSDELSEADERQERNLDLLFSSYIDRDRERDLKYIAEYYEYLADKISHKRLVAAVSIKLLKRFEATFLMLRQILASYLESIGKQADSICEGLSLERLFAALAIETSENRRHYETFLDRMFAGFIEATNRGNKDQSLVSENSLLNAKIALGRLAQLAFYAASLKLDEPAEPDSEFSDHYSPDLADKAKVLALLNVLRSQANSLQDENVRGRLIGALEKLEIEIRKPRPRWKMAIGTFFILFGFLADLKTIEPRVYDPLYRTVEALVRVLHEEGTVQHHRKDTSFPLGGTPQSLLQPPELDPEYEDED